MSYVLAEREALKGPAILAGPVPPGLNPSVDYARFAAALLVVVFHATHIGPIGGQLPVAFFTIILVFMTLRSRAARPGGLAPRMARLLRPWVVWSVIYGLLQLVQGLLERRPPWPLLREWLPPEGIQSQLWFLPFAALVTLALFALPRRWLRDTPQCLALPAAAAAVGLGLLAAAGYLPTMPILRLYAVFLPGAAVGILFYALHRNRGAVLAAAAGLGLFGVGLASAGLSFTMPFILAAPIAALALCCPLPALPGARLFGPLSMDVYLNHILSLAVVTALQPLDTQEPAGVAAAILLSIAGGVLAARLPLGQYLR